LRRRNPPTNHPLLQHWHLLLLFFLTYKSEIWKIPHFNKNHNNNNDQNWHFLFLLSKSLLFGQTDGWVTWQGILGVGWVGWRKEEKEKETNDGMRGEEW
jgi:hypothetical protein